MGAELKYTDRDVRENSDFLPAVLTYLEQYTGEFEYLIDMKMRAAQGMNLTVPMVRGVLNCMRHDPRVQNLPAPKPVEYGVLIDMEEERPKRREPQQPRKRYGGQDPCDEDSPHDRHDYDLPVNRKGETWQYTCPGIFTINRGFTDRDGYWSGDVLTPARIKVPFATARGGMLIHRIVPEKSHFVWRARQHTWGYYTLYLSVKTLCRYPSYLTDPYLLGYAITKDQEEFLDWANRKKCPHCQKEWEAARG